MNVANVELCRELYELSGWRSDYILNAATGETYDTDDYFRTFITPTIGDDVFLYDLGYLLRKLEPANGSVAYNPLKNLITGTIGAYVAKARGDDWGSDMCSDVEPEDAAARLCIHLIRRGVLKIENSQLPKEQQ